VSFNDHEGSTKSYRFTRENYHELAPVDFVPLQREITAETEQGASVSVTMHDGSIVRFREVASDYDPTDRDAAYAHVRARQEKGEIATGLLYIDERSADMHEIANTVERPLVDVPFEALCPGRKALEKLMDEYR
jgi:2-oxoglutarate ferredoxin oxidoreductase subunit beta